MRALAALLLSAAPAIAQQAPDYLIESAALLRVASHIAAQCADVQVDVDADTELRVSVYDLLARDGWRIDDPRLHSDAARAAVLQAAEVRYAELGLDTPLASAQVCPVARAEAKEQSTLGRLFRVDDP